jgi:hypothetical protein
MKLAEREVTRQIVAWMRSQGWVPYRKNVGMLRDGDRVTRFGKPGECDWLFVRPATHKLGPAACEVEIKATGVTLSPSRKRDKEQLEYIAKRNHLGIPATYVDSLEALQQWYYQRGLNTAWRRAI